MTPHYYLNEAGTSLFGVGRADAVLNLGNAKDGMHLCGRKLALIDRDGVIIEKAPAHEYFKSAREMKILPGVSEAIARLNKLGFIVAVVSNQPGLAKNLFTVDDLRDMTVEIERQILTDLTLNGDAGRDFSAQACIDGVFFCPHKKPDVGGVVSCTCRKPLPGMLLAAMDLYGVKNENTFMFGDFAQDIEAAVKAGAQPVYVATEHDECVVAFAKIKELYPEIWARFKYNSLLAAVKALF